jgi:hypothetical protein
LVALGQKLFHRARLQLAVTFCDPAQALYVRLVVPTPRAARTNINAGLWHFPLNQPRPCPSIVLKVHEAKR